MLQAGSRRFARRLLEDAATNFGDRERGDEEILIGPASAIHAIRDSGRPPAW